MQLGLLRHKHEQQARAQAPALPPPGELSRAFLDGLPFELTAHQLAALDELEADLGAPAHAAAAAGRRGLRQDRRRPVLPGARRRGGAAGRAHGAHRDARRAARGHRGAAPRRARAERALTASLTASQRREALERIAGGEAQLVDRHARAHPGGRRLRRLGLVVVDEQHRFGVEQRDALVRRAEREGRAPHVLLMTATPIPRTLALTVYGDLDVTVIAGAPAGRQPVVTRLVEEAQREVGYEFVRKQIAKGRQVYVVCPAIEESESDRRGHGRG